MTVAEDPPLYDCNTTGGSSALSPDQETSADPGRPDRPAGAERPLRAHARRNREKLVAAARAAFTAADDTVPLDGIARAAGVGIGTLYRHFPTREALVEAVYAAELDDVTASASALLDTLPPERALRAWLERYAAFVATKRSILNTLHSGWASGRLVMPATRERITAAIGTMLAQGARAGSLRGDVAPDDVTAMLLGVFLSTAADDEPERTERLLDLVVDALRPPGSS
ncbi:TetR family transcriptional regulator [Streptomyces sp. SID7813]|uniref:TetR family transcriptional regulator n=1 Tax=Streptomyces coelicolor (strain ATCC BAA-471 / A3(2) / M145) TaxID=100226 RepID=Q9RL56_STRCO|nr:TetR family transcriptional regulator [Streptomyces sp. SID7813]QFI47576.1 TetR/AcrR family transcriptional regulator [Streptomyces coelicolor A3(2)]CAB56660.1 putative tetR family transcriptional regulator [Streptomyces coelicolor A3(2)]